MLTIAYSRDYVSKKGNTTFVYTVDGSKEELANYKKAQGKFYREADGKGAEPAGTPLYFTTRYVGEQGKLVISNSGNVVADMSEFRKAQSLSEQFGGNFGQEIAKVSALNILGNTTRKGAPNSDEE